MMCFSIRDIFGRYRGFFYCHPNGGRETDRIAHKSGQGTGNSELIIVLDPIS